METVRREGALTRQSALHNPVLPVPGQAFQIRVFGVLAGARAGLLPYC
jgi:hypothetical protein